MNHTIADYVRNNFEGMLVIGDIHSDYDSFMRAALFADENNLFLHALGDLVDRGTKPFEVVKEMNSRVKAGTAGFTIGNHDNKFYRHASGNKVKFSRDGLATFEYVGKDRSDEFLRMYCEIMDTPVMAGFFHLFDDYTLVHAASHPCIWEGVTEFGKSAKSRALVGETNGEYDDTGYPVRLYTWVDEIPSNKTVVVGHDRMPYDKLLEEPLHVTNKDGGKAIFMDTGCGKGGFLTAAVFNHTDKFNLDRFVEFK
jgi:hypothetical protein